MRQYILLIVLIFFFGDAVAQFIYFNKHSVDNGLSNNAVICSVQDKDGFMWFGTKDGLNRFDGYSFKQFYSDSESNTGLGSNFIHSLLVDRDKKLWVGTDQGLYIYDPYAERFTCFAGVEGAEILQIEEDKVGNVWFISNNKLFSYHPHSRKLIKIGRTANELVSAFAIDRKGQVWVSGSNQLMNVHTGKRIPFLVDGSAWVEDMFADDTGSIWIGTAKHGLMRLDPNAKKVKNLALSTAAGSPVFVRDIQQVDADRFWIATESGLVIYSKASESYTSLRHELDNPWSLSDNAVYSITVDHQKGIWVGTYFGGISYYHKNNTWFQKIYPRPVPNSMQGNAVREMVLDTNGNVWIGTEDSGLNFWDTSTDQFTNFSTAEGVAHTNIHGLALVGDSLLIGTFDHGMNVLDIRTKKVTGHYTIAHTFGSLGSNFIVQILQTKKGNVLLATARGLYEYTPGTNVFSMRKEVPDHIFYTSLFEDRDGNLWLGTWRNGLYFVDTHANKTTVFHHDVHNPLSINSNRVNSVCQDSNGSMWIATENGLALWSSQGIPIRRFTKKDGLPSNLILSMREDEHKRLWISTTHGLICLDINTHRMTTFTKESGILGLQFNYNSALKDKTGRLYFGSSHGLIRFHPDSLQQPQYNHQILPLLITGIQSLQQDVKIGKENGAIDTSITYLKTIDLQHDASTITIAFSALNFVSSSSMSYLYKLDGFDKGWTLVRSGNKAYFTRIPTGKYEFHVKAVNSSGDTISEERVLQIIVHPPIWASPWAYFVYFLLIAVLIYYMIFSYDKYIKTKNRRRLEVIKTHRERELYRSKMEFFTRMAHDLKTPLTLIKAPLEKIMGKDFDQKDKVQQLLQTMHKNTEKLVQLTNTILDFRNVENSQLVLQLQKTALQPLFQDYVEEFRSVFQSENITVSYNGDPIAAYIDVDVIYKIVDNLLTNAIKYADKTIVITLSEDLHEQTWVLTIKNDGILLDMAERYNIFEPFHRAPQHHQIEGSGLGLALAYSFAKLHAGNLELVENTENLNVFVLTIPLTGRYSEN